MLQIASLSNDMEECRTLCEVRIGECEHIRWERIGQLQGLYAEEQIAKDNVSSVDILSVL